jgi:glycosyltransferase involved in cell wall biosynthesis
MPALSVVIITFNEEKNIGRCIDSVVAVADEIIVLDSYSTDETIEIARGKGAVIHQQKFAGYGKQKNDALQLCSNNLVLSLDADEMLDNVLIAEILEEKKGAAGDAYLMNRCTNYCGKFIRHGSWYPDRKIRLFNKTIARWSKDMIHEKVEIPPGVKTKQLKGDILHYSFNSIEEHVAQNNKFSSISAQTLFANGRRTNLFKIIINPWWAFILSYIIRLGFADGLFGFIVAVNISHLTFLKHTKLMTLQRQK